MQWFTWSTVLALSFAQTAIAWTPAVPVLNGTQDRLSARVAMDGNGKIHVGWHERENNYYQVWYTHNTSGAFSTPVRLSHGGSIHSYGPVFSINGADVHLVWTSDQAQNNNFEIWYRRQTAGAWGPITNASNTAIKSLGQTVAARETIGPIVAFQEALYADDNYDVLYTEWNGSGFGSAVNLSNTPGGRVYGSVAPAVAIAANGDVAVVWPERITGDYHFNARHRINGVWQPRQEISTKATGPGAAGIAAGPDNQIHIVYSATNAVEDGNDIVWYQKWNGSSWTAPLDLSRGFSNLLRPKIAVDDRGFAHVVADNAQGNPNGEIWYTTNMSGAWSPWINVSNKPGRSVSADIAYGKDTLVVIWSDDGNASGPTGFVNVWYSVNGLPPVGPSGTLTGTVVDQFNQPISNALVSTGIYETTTAANGIYSLSLPPGTYNVTASKAFFTGQTVNNVAITQDATTTQNFTIVGQPPAPVQTFTAHALNTRNLLTWRNPNSGNFAGTIIRFRTDGYPTGPTDGALLLSQNAQPDSTHVYEHTGLTNGVTYYYAAFAHNGGGSFAAGVTAGATPSGPFDFDRDGDVDQADFGRFQACLTGQTVPQYDPQCDLARCDSDLDVDQDDLRCFLKCMSGPNEPADPNCAN